MAPSSGVPDGILLSLYSLSLHLVRGVRGYFHPLLRALVISDKIDGSL
jgi:hypothetical protein